MSERKQPALDGGPGAPPPSASLAAEQASSASASTGGEGAGIRLADGVRIFRSKNAGPFRTTIDIFYARPDPYRAVKESGALTAGAVAKRLGLAEEMVEGIFFSDETLGVKITIRKHAGMASGDLRCADTFGAQQYAPLKDWVIHPDAKR